MPVFDITLRDTESTFDITLGSPIGSSADIQKTYAYKMSRGGAYLGLLPNVISDFGYSQDINTPAAQMTIEVSETSDIQTLPPDYIVTESGDKITTETGDRLTTERALDIVGNLNSRALIRNNNDVEVYEYSSRYPNGILVFSGYISKWKTRYGATDTTVITVLSHGAELDNYIIQGSSTVDSSQLTQDASTLIYDEFDLGKGGGWNLAGQTITTGLSATNISAVLAKLAAATSTPVTVQCKVWASYLDYFTGVPLGTAELTISSMVAADYTFTFSTPISVNPNNVYFISITCPGTIGDGALVYYKNSDVYSGGNYWTNNYAGGSGGGSWFPSSSQDMYFKVFTTGGATSSPFLNEDPTQILRDIIDSYVSRGGTVDYSDTSTELTAVERDYTFRVNTVLEGIKKVQDMSPSDWYWYVDPATSIIYFKETSTTADHLMVYGRHVQTLEIEATVENLKNSIYFTGGQVAGENLYITDTDTDSIEDNAGRIGLARITDNRVTITETATAVVDAFLDANSREGYTITLVVNDEDYDTKLFKLGDVIGFAGFGNFVDSLLIQVVRILPAPDYITLTLGILPRRTAVFIEEISRRLTQVETVDNPDTPS